MSQAQLLAPAVDSPVMKLIDKVRALAANRSELDRAAGLPMNTTSAMINTGSVPNVDKALRIARALGVSLDWLADDSQGMPPIPTGQTATFTQLLTDPERAQWQALQTRRGRDVVMAAAAYLLMNEEVQAQAAQAIATMDLREVRRAAQAKLRIAGRKAPPRGDVIRHPRGDVRRYDAAQEQREPPTGQERRTESEGEPLSDD